MGSKFIKKFWSEENILFYLHFEDERAIRQIEVKSNTKKKLSIDNPIEGDSMLYDQSIDDLELTENDFITRQDFEEAWEQK